MTLATSVFHRVALVSQQVVTTPTQVGTAVFKVFLNLDAHLRSIRRRSIGERHLTAGCLVFVRFCARIIGSPAISKRG